MLNSLTFSLAGQDGTDVFFGLHRYEVLERPQYRRLQIGTIKGEQSRIRGRVAGELSKVPYAEPTWLSEGYHSPYYTEVSEFTLPFVFTETFVRRITENFRELYANLLMRKYSTMLR